MMDVRMHPPTMHQSPMYQPNMHPYEAQQHFGNTKNHPGPMQMSPVGSGSRFSGGQVGHPGTQAFNQQHRFVEKGVTDDFQMIQRGIDRRNMVSNQVPVNQRGKRGDKVIIIKQS